MNDEIIKSVTELTTIDYDSVLQEAVSIFSEQALVAKAGADVTLKDIQLAKGKSENFLASVAGMIEISHKIELLSAERFKFKRSDELQLLNSLREQFTKSAKVSDRMVNMCMGRLDLLEDRLANSEVWTNEDLAQVSILQSYLEGAICTINSITTGTQKLIKTERESGGRSSGESKGNSTNISTFLEGVVTEGKDKKKVRPRKVSKEELMDDGYEIED